VDELKVRDWLISSDDEDNRRQGVTAIKRSIELAAALGIKTIVVHAGSTNADWPLEKRLYKAFQANQTGTPGYMELQDQVTKSRASKIIPRFDAVQKSITELLEYCRPFRIRLGIENRYHVLDIPNLEEMESLLEMGDESELGFWFDTGHAQTLDRLGFIPHEAWLTRFSNRIIGVHLHDAMGISDHRAIGNGEIDFTLIARYVPARAIKTLEIRPNTNAEELRNSLQFLADQGIVQGVL
jgi:sugar phosphate isomerase/epimerase